MRPQGTHGIKTVADLTEEDFAQFPVWLQRDSVTPWRGSGQIPVLSLVRTRVITATGNQYQGFAVLTEPKLVVPVVFNAGRQVHLFRGIEMPSDSDLKKLYDELTSSAEAFFPVLVRASVDADLESVTSLYDGFTYFSGGAFATVK